MDISNSIFNIIHKNETGVIINAKIVPNSSCSAIADYAEDYIRIKITAPPLENKANKELMRFLSKLLDINKSRISIISGEKSKLKKILIKDADIDFISQKLLFVINSEKK